MNWNPTTLTMDFQKGEKKGTQYSETMAIKKLRKQI